MAFHPSRRARDAVATVALTRSDIILVLGKDKNTVTTSRYYDHPRGPKAQSHTRLRVTNGPAGYMPYMPTEERNEYHDVD